PANSAGPAWRQFAHHGRITPASRSGYGRITLFCPARGRVGTMAAGNEADGHEARRLGATPVGRTKGKTRWERMRMDELALAQLTGILAAAKASEGKSAKTIAWYEHALHDYRGWLAREGLPETLGSFTLERARAYTVDLQRRSAFAHHPE